MSDMSCSEPAGGSRGRLRRWLPCCLARWSRPLCSPIFRLGPAGQVLLLRDRRRRHRPGVGPRRDARPWARGCSSAWAPTSWPCTSSSPTPRSGDRRPGLHVAVRHRRRSRRAGSRSAAPRSRCWRSSLLPDWWRRVLGLARVQAPRQGRLLRDPDPGARRRRSPILIGQQATTGGTNGLSGFRSFFGFDLKDPANKLMLYFIAAVVLLLALAVARQLMQQPLRRAAGRRTRRRRNGCASSATTRPTSSWSPTSLAALMASIAGALFVPIVGIISPARGRRRPVHRVPDRRGHRRPRHAARARCSARSAWHGRRPACAPNLPVGWTYVQGLLFIAGRRLPARRPGLAAGLFARLPAARRERHRPTAARRRAGPETRPDAQARELGGQPMTSPTLLPDGVPRAGGLRHGRPKYLEVAASPSISTGSSRSTTSTSTSSRATCGS